VSGNSEPSIQQVLAEFLADQRSRLAPRTYRNYEYVVELLSHCLNGYAYQSLDEVDRTRWEAAYDAGDEEAFCRLFGPLRQRCRTEWPILCARSVAVGLLLDDQVTTKDPCGRRTYSGGALKIAGSWFRERMLSFW